jgi:hypothetical protein
MRKVELSRCTELRDAAVCLISAPMEWTVQYTSDGANHLGRTETSEEAIELACRLLAGGADVFAIGLGEHPVSVGRDEIARIYRTWVRAESVLR